MRLLIRATVPRFCEFYPAAEALFENVLPVLRNVEKNPVHEATSLARQSFDPELFEITPT
ncbi:hypothetical protein C5Y93_04990 [Blastopirellula marina]|uniref:Uncharacterized protein n=1 Tax=Blastopirellula marina TaxID=124 RepID=A0A2S8GSK7_9BACT|nr:hypothetical protein C5Y93_04990 [Blastopirellula marina]